MKHISEEVFDKVHEKLASKSFKPGRPIGGDFYLRGLLNAQNAEIIWYDRRTYYKKKSKGQSSVITFVPYSIVQGVLHVSNSINAEVVERVIFHLNRILSQPGYYQADCVKCDRRTETKA